ncbi:hypothetical protein CesoFtcFv8_020487 [Champsocephalus esox]|uniref:HECT domain-containing protein n=1 Tax=Champsocephalus esox TaxID=159716 RepID=A0AAN8GKQ5_9TELE|nr:hypothetical protein CesoFtcFv8_020487 [Champsocephalus esox]
MMSPCPHLGSAPPAPPPGFGHPRRIWGQTHRPLPGFGHPRRIWSQTHRPLPGFGHPRRIWSQTHRPLPGFGHPRRIWSQTHRPPPGFGHPRRIWSQTHRPPPRFWTSPPHLGSDLPTKMWFLPRMRNHYLQTSPPQCTVHSQLITPPHYTAPAHPIYIEGVGEGAVDEGGPTREFCTLLMRQIQAYLIFEGPEERRTLALDSVALQKGHYKIIGQMIVVCLLQGLVSPHFLSDRLFQQVCGLPPTPASLYLVYDMGLRAKFQKMAEATTVAKEAVEEASEELSLMGGMRFLSNLSQRDELLAAVLHHYCDGRLLEALQQFREGFQMYGANKVLIALKTVFIEDTTPIEAEDICRAFEVSSLSVEGSNRRRMEARTIGFWRDWLQTVEEDGHAQFPTANTCAFVLRLPIFRQYDKFQEAMENGISWGAIFGLG